MSRNPNILLVEDNDLDFEMVNRMLTRIGAPNKLVRAKDGLDAMDILHGQVSGQEVDPPFIVLLDLNMPRMNGIEFLSKLRSDNRFKNISVFVFTTSESPDDINAAFDNATNGYIVKPDTTSELKDVLTKFLDYIGVTKIPAPI